MLDAGTARAGTDSFPKQLKQHLRLRDIVTKPCAATVATAVDTPGGRADMTPAQITRVRRSFATAVLKLNDVSDAFCRRLHALDPSCNPLFDGDAVAQRVRVGGMLAGLVGALGQPDAVRPELPELARPDSRDVALQHHAMIEEAIMAALREVLGDAFDSATQRAWLLAYDQVARSRTTATSDERAWVRAA